VYHCEIRGDCPKALCTKRYRWFILVVVGYVKLDPDLYLIAKKIKKRGDYKQGWKKPRFKKKKPAQWVFWVFLVFLGFFWVFLGFFGFFAQTKTRGFLGLFSVSRIL
jgi:hypothetical protein